MTIKELYAWGVQNGALDMEIEVAFRDGGGTYSGADELDDPIITNSQVYGGDTAKKVVLL